MHNSPKRTVVLGASASPDRYAFQAFMQLRAKGHEPLPVGVRAGKIDETDILLGTPALEDVDTVTLYVNPDRQRDYYAYILGLKPRRIIFNPGTENAEFARMAREQGIEVVIGCTLVMLTLNNY
jgi:hypothetical protein